jgi:hypothetical protein
MKFKERVRYWKDICDQTGRARYKVSLWVLTIAAIVGIILTLIFHESLCERFGRIQAGAILTIIIALCIVIFIWGFFYTKYYLIASLVPFDETDASDYEEFVLRKNKTTTWIFAGLALLASLFLVCMSTVFWDLLEFLEFFLGVALFASVLIILIYSGIVFMALALKWRHKIVSTRTLKRILAVESLTAIWGFSMFAFSARLVGLILSIVLATKVPVEALDLTTKFLEYLSNLSISIFTIYAFLIIFIPGIIFWRPVATILGILISVSLSWVIFKNFNWKLALFAAFTYVIVWDGFFIVRKEKFGKKVIAFFAAVGTLAVAIPVGFFLSLPWHGVEALQVLALLISVMASLCIDTWMASYVT